MRTLPKVLVVDDDPVVGKSFHRVLSNKGYAVVTAADGAEALSKIAAENYDMVYTDIKMPGMDGIEVARHIKNRQPWLPVVIVSGFATAENEARAKAAGVSAVLHKPLSPEMIEESAREALREKEAGVAAVAEDAAAEPALAEPAPALAPEAPAAELPAPLVEAPPATKPRTSLPKRLALVLGAPLAGLAYVILLPIAGPFLLVGALVWFAAKAIARRADRLGKRGRNIALFLAAPFIGLAYAVALPFVGLGMLVWMGVKAAMKRTAANRA